jgi:hypothetical protein
VANTTLGGVTLNGDSKSFIAEKSVRKEALVTPMPLYGLDSEDTDIFDFGGVIKSINISGVYVDTTIANIQSFIQSCENLIQGQQDKEAGYPLTFVDDYHKNSSGGNMKVKIMDFESTASAGSPLIIRWTFKLFEASENA